MTPRTKDELIKFANNATTTYIDTAVQCPPDTPELATLKTIAQAALNAAEKAGATTDDLKNARQLLANNPDNSQNRH